MSTNRTTRQRPPTDRVHQTDHTDHTDLAHLVRAAGDGDEAALGEIITRYQSLVLATAIRVTGQVEDARDVTQQTWLILMQHVGSIHSPDYLPRWLVTTARREAFRLMAARRRTVSWDEQTMGRVADPGDGPDLQAERRETVERVRAALDRLPRAKAELLVMLVGHGQSYADVAAALGRPIGSLGPLRARYLRHLSVALAA